MQIECHQLSIPRQAPNPAHALKETYPPTLIASRVHHNLIRERITLARCDWRDMIRFGVRRGDDFHRSLLKHHLHRPSDLCSLYAPR